MTNTLMLLSIGLPWLGAIGVWRVGDKHPQTQHLLAAIFSLAAGVASVLLFPFATAEATLSIHMGGIFGDFTLVPDGLGILIAVIATVVGSLAVIFSVDYMRAEEQLGRYYALILFFIGAMAGLGLTGSLLMMFFFWEITAFCSYALISFHNDDPKAVAGGIKALIVTQIGGVGLLLGALFIRTYFDSYQISLLLSEAQTLPLSTLNIIAFGFLIAAIAKSAQVPLHTWLPDAMEAPTPVTALIHAATMVNAGVYLLARFYPAFEPVPGWSTTVIMIGLLSALLAAFMAVVSVDLKRLLAYSTISQLGYMIYAVGVGAIFASHFHLLSHAIFKALLFLGAGAVIHTTGTRDMREMGGLSVKMPIVCTIFIIGSLALIGIPITNGFISKELILESGLKHGPAYAYIGMLCGVGITALYAIRMVSMVFFTKKRKVEAAHDAPSAMRISLFTLAVGTLTTWIVAGSLSKVMAETLPYQQIHPVTTPELVTEIITAPATWIAMAIAALGISLWLLRGYVGSVTKFLKPFAHFAETGMGFERLNHEVVNLTLSLSSFIRLTQTGQLNWNVLAILGTLGVLLTILIWVV